MKKLFPYILIVLIVVQLLAPFTVGIGVKNNFFEVKNNTVEAEGGTDDETGISLYAESFKTDTTITIYAITVYQKNSWLTTADEKVVALINQPGGNSTGTIEDLKNGIESYDLDSPEVIDKVKLFKDKYPNINFDKIYKKTFTNLIPDTTYNLTLFASQDYKSWWTAMENVARLASKVIVVGMVVEIVLPDDSFMTPEAGTINKTPIEEYSITTNEEGFTTEEKAGEIVAINDAAILPVCKLNNLGGCVGIILYRLVFQPSSRIFAITGKLLDYTLFYSIQDTSYRSQFVVEGWGMVRDFVNMFFIFVLLYIAFGTILKLNGVNTKQMIINVVIIGLLINFSLFATQVIIDASNILTRVFYNQIVVGPKVKGVVVEELGLGGSKQLTAALVAKINPQKLILNAGKAGEIPVKGLNSNGDNSGDNPSGVDNATFIMVTILASILNIVGLWTFLMVSMIFIARVVGLWLAMILVPIAFFSYTIPQMQDMDMIGWKKWWPETIKLAFLAPVFIFFLYLIIQFLDSGLGVMDADGKSGLDFFIAIIVPFAFLMILLIKAKEITTKMSGTIGQTVTNTIKTVGGLALGGAAIGTAMLGRRVIGQTMAKASRGDTATQKFQTAKVALAHGDTSYMDKLNLWQKTKGAIGSVAQLGKIYGKTNNVFDIKTKKMTALPPTMGGIGAILNRAQQKTQETDFARHTTDEAVDKAGFKGKTMNELGGAQQERVKTVFVRDNKSKWAQEEEDKFRADPSRGYDDKKKLRPEEIKELRGNVTARAEAEFAKEMKNAAKGVNAFTRVLSKANTGSYDVRKLASATTDKRASVFSKIPVALIAAVAMGVRGGLKSVGTSHGSIKVEGNFMKDLGNTISDSLKGMKVDVNLEHVGETKSSADAHGGGGGTHH